MAQGGQIQEEGDKPCKTVHCATFMEKGSMNLANKMPRKEFFRIARKLTKDVEQCAPDFTQAKENARENVGQGLRVGGVCFEYFRKQCHISSCPSPQILAVLCSCTFTRSLNVVRWPECVGNPSAFIRVSGRGCLSILRRCPSLGSGCGADVCQACRARADQGGSAGGQGSFDVSRFQGGSPCSHLDGSGAGSGCGEDLAQVSARVDRCCPLEITCRLSPPGHSTAHAARDDATSFRAPRLPMLSPSLLPVSFSQCAVFWCGWWNQQFVFVDTRSS